MAEIHVPLEISVTLQTNPLGGAVTVSVDDIVADSAREALLNDIERKLVGQQNNLVYRTVREAHDQLERYATTNDYHVEPLIDSFDGVETSRSRTAVYAEWSWEHKVMSFWEFGVSPHTISGNPLLRFYWEKIGQWIKTDSVEWGSETGGIPPSRAVRDSLHSLRRELS